jgi:prepilin-type N-terminal cleavage/methylation domain-containing protein
MIRIPRRRRYGFTLIELLVVITIIGILMALLLPAVQAAREAGRQAQCMSNQHNLALAMGNFEHSKKSFPGYIGDLTVGSRTVAMSWVVNLLPFLDHRDIYTQLQTIVGTASGNSLNANDIKAVMKPMSILMCPTDAPDSRELPWLSYVVNRGRNGIDNMPPVGVCFNQSTDYQLYYRNSSTSRAGFTASQVGIDYITAHDGTSNTLLLAESPLTPTSISGTMLQQPPQRFPYLSLYERNDPTGSAISDSTGWFYYRPYSKWIDVTFSNGSATQSTYATTTELSLGFEWSGLAVTRLNNGTPKITDQIASLHPGLVIVSFCDGHQDKLQESMDITTFKHIMTPYGLGYQNLGKTYAPDAPEWIQEVLDESKIR